MCPFKRLLLWHFPCKNVDSENMCDFYHILRKPRRCYIDKKQLDPQKQLNRPICKDISLQTGFFLKEMCPLKSLLFGHFPYK